MKSTYMKCIQIGLSIPQNLVDQIDTVRGDVTRSRYIWRMLEKTFVNENNINGNSEIEQRSDSPASIPELSGRNANVKRSP